MIKLCAVLAAFLLLPIGCADSQQDQPREFDVLIVNGTVYDGSAEAPRQTHIGLIGDRIASMDAAENAPAGVRIDASGFMVTPVLSIRIRMRLMTC